MIGIGDRLASPQQADDHPLAFIADWLDYFLERRSEMATPSPSKALSPRASPQVRQYREEVAPGGPSSVDRTSSSKQPGHASVLIEYFEQSTALHSEQKPSFRVQLRTSSPKGPKIMPDRVLTDTSGSRLSFPTNANELSLRDTSPVFHPALHQFDPEDVSSPPLRQVQSITFPTSRPLLVPSSQLSVDSSVSPVLSTACQTSGQENVSSPDTSQSYYNCINRQVDDRSENNISRSTHRSTKFDPDVLDNIISNVIRRLVLPELASIRQSASGAAALASQTASKFLPAADSADVVELNVNQVLPKSELRPVSEQDAREGDVPSSQPSDSPMGLSKLHILLESGLESSVQFHSKENVNDSSNSHFFEPSDEKKESSATILNNDATFVTSRNFIEEQMSIENDTITQDPPNGNALATAAEGLQHNDGHLIPFTSKHLVDDTGSDGDAHYFSSEEYPRPMSVVSQSDVDRRSESTQVPTKNSLSNLTSPIVAYHHGRKYSEFSFESGTEGPLNISSSASLHNYSIKHELPPQTTQCPLSESGGNIMSNDIFGVTRNTKSSPYGDANMDHINSPLGIHYMIEDPQSYAPWLRRVQDLDQIHVRDMIKNESTTAKPSTPIGKRNKIDPSDVRSESPTMIQDSASRVRRSAPDNKSRTDNENNGNPRGARNASPSPKTPSERATVRGARQISRNENGTPTKSRIKNDRKVNNDLPLSNDFANQYMAALVNRLLANDLQRNSRDTEILTGVAKLAGEMRMGLEEIRQTIASENQQSRDDINRTISFEVSKIRGPRPYQSTRKTDSPVGQQQGQKKNLLLKAFGGIKSSSDLQRVENLYVQFSTQSPTLVC
ncbi:hypothetical protein LIPSTDRAFT_287176 [Lipomyces starkeyi NRRL Y-11557]|uniref:Uncharacterized protein n=1 Tax=Lipomyces starkeyi NRRL Y-11557 TaxID=675824 RepID=A0A1E3Q654_LIPST|nr:hypothetical protein LIPSTDRAFT_287176 [Lipomyces starkeyi NRRL Y-11557]